MGRQLVKLFPCVFLSNVLCSFRKTKGSYVMDRCFECPHYREFERSMEREEGEFWDEVDEIRRTGVHS